MSDMEQYNIDIIKACDRLVDAAQHNKLFDVRRHNDEGIIAVRETEQNAKAFDYGMGGIDLTTKQNIQQQLQSMFLKFPEIRNSDWAEFWKRLLFGY